MVTVGRLELSVLGVVVVILLLTSPVVGIIDVTERNPTTVGDGTATASVERLDTDALTIDRGRFGTGVMYLRIPEATVAVTDVRGRPRIVYRIRVPELGVDTTSTELLTRGRATNVRLGPRDRGLDPAVVSDENYRGIVTVRIQSFERDRTIHQANETIEVDR
jgi:hypothetical protein